jgi:hypothetical protein
MVWRGAADRAADSGTRASSRGGCGLKRRTWISGRDRGRPMGGTLAELVGMAQRRIRTVSTNHWRHALHHDGGLGKEAVDH